MEEINKKIKTYDIDDVGSLVFAVSFVEEPAIKSNYIFMNENKKPRYVNLSSDDKRLVYGAVLVPDMLIYRNKESFGEDCYVKYSSDVIESLSQKFMKNGYQFNFTKDHKYDVDNITCVESWIKVDMNNDKSIALGLDKDLPIGTWFIGSKIDNNDIWGDIKNGKWNGYSIEGFVNFIEQEINNENNNNDMAKKLVKQEEEIIVNDGFWEKIKAMIKEALKEPEVSDSEAEVVAEVAVEEIKDEKVVEESPIEMEEQVAVEVADEVVDVIETEADSVEEVKEDLQTIVDELNVKIAELENEVVELKKQNVKLSKQPSTKPIKQSSEIKGNPRDAIRQLYGYK